MCVCLHSKFSEDSNKKEVRGSERKPAELSYAVRCLCEFEDPSHLRAAISVKRKKKKLYTRGRVSQFHPLVRYCLPKASIDLSFMFSQITHPWARTHICPFSVALPLTPSQSGSLDLSSAPQKSCLYYHTLLNKDERLKWPKSQGPSCLLSWYSSASARSESTYANLNTHMCRQTCTRLFLPPSWIFIPL